MNHSSHGPRKSSHNLSEVKVNHRSLFIISTRGVAQATHENGEARQATAALFSWFWVRDFLMCFIYEFRLCSCPTQFLLTLFNLTNQWWATPVSVSPPTMGDQLRPIREGTRQRLVKPCADIGNKRHDHNLDSRMWASAQELDRCQDLCYDAISYFKVCNSLFLPMMVLKLLATHNAVIPQ